MGPLRTDITTVKHFKWNATVSKRAGNKAMFFNYPSPIAIMYPESTVYWTYEVRGSKKNVLIACLSETRGNYGKGMR